MNLEQYHVARHWAYAEKHIHRSEHIMCFTHIIGPKATEIKNPLKVSATNSFLRLNNRHAETPFLIALGHSSICQWLVTRPTEKCPITYTHWRDPFR